jgi:hypothetical protein
MGRDDNAPRGATDRPSLLAMRRGSSLSIASLKSRDMYLAEVKQVF